MKKATEKDLDQFGVEDMQCDGYFASIRKAARLKGEHVHCLPSGVKIKAFETSFFPAAPRHWLREKGCYVVPVSKEWGLWFDWTKNNGANTAVISSVKGMNPITGQKMSGVALEDYVKKCPIHDLAFGTNPSNAAENLFCSECGYNWPHHNYVSNPNILWWDGFRQPDGKVRQFFFTDDEERDVASAVIGKESTVPAFGFAFYKTKTVRYSNHYSGYDYSGYGGQNHDLLKQMEEIEKWSKWSEKDKWKNQFKTGRGLLRSHTMDNVVYGSETVYCDNNTTTNYNLSSTSDQAEYLFMNKATQSLSCQVDRKYSAGGQELRTQNRDVSIGAGALINQGLTLDSGGVAAFKESPEASIRVYFCFIEHFNEIIKGGLNLPFERKQGYLTNKVKVG